MATRGTGTAASAQPIVQPVQRNVPAPSPLSTVSPPSKRELASWWKKFRKTTEKTDEKVEIQPGIFGVPLADSIRYANVAISLQNESGESFIYGYVPIVVAKCGVFLKEKATDVEGIFRLNGSAKRIKDLQTIFNSPDRYGKGLDWTGYTVHDAANILRRYLNQLPEPIVPLDFYDRFREPLRRTQRPPQTDGEAQPVDFSLDEHNAAVSAYQKLITELPPLNRQLLLYILDLLAVFASKSDLNRMTAANLAAIFQPGIISHPTHDMAPREYRLSQDVLIFLIENQDNFLIGMSGTAVDEKTQKDVESGAPSLKSPKAVVRSASNASAGAESMRKFGVRRNVSVSSRGSRDRGSPGVSSPGTPSGLGTFPDGTAGAKIARSNTVPSKRSPAIAPSRFQRLNDATDSTPPAQSPATITPSTPNANGDATESKSSRSGSIGPDEAFSSQGATGQLIEQIPGQPALPQPATQPQQPNVASFPPVQVNQSVGPAHSVTPTPITTRERKISNLFPKSPIFGPSEPQQQRQPRKLQKKPKIPGSANESAQSSVNSLHADDAAPFKTPLASPDLNSASRLDPLAAPTGPALTNTAPTPVNEAPTRDFSTPGSQTANTPQNNTTGLKPRKSPTTSTKSRSSFTDHSEADALDENKVAPEDKEKRRHRWRFSSSAKKAENSPLAPPPAIGHNAGARGSNSSLGSSHRPRKSFTGDSQQTQSASLYGEMIPGQQSLVGPSSNESGEGWKENADTEKKGIFGKWKAKMSQTKEERQAEKERARSPPATDHGASRNSLSAFAQEHLSPRGRSFDRSRDEGLPGLQERQASESQNQVRKASFDLRRGEGKQSP
ncbi:uncharacterized protein A1O9_08660 [Exophiala aquamarina CBS 119918]|uniref:Rho-GAP domain-containing protein n=1 Tax=Exophiala aquamarina CBS 119918 TaxID=1182545 RepID=A0A072P6T7_9EURO|nr:uncharacterized protein A1O9_08660 [Exophiala aquamarina CBS 119918]KEF55008.1 hypothetical protein A1O9_08660 [Exophiala aquamarina CBS 119918]